MTNLSTPYQPCDKLVFCSYCVQCHKRGVLNFTRKYDNAFILDGFHNWKKGRERLQRHERSECHKEAILKLNSMKGPSVIEQLSSETKRTQATRRRMLLKLLRSLTFLLRQGLAIRGHKESEGNLIQLLELQSTDCPELKQWMTRYLSHGVINEMITLMGNTLLRKLLANIRAVKWFSIMGDETRDISNHEQLSIIISWVDLNYDIHEDLIGTVHVPDTTSATLTF